MTLTQKVLDRAMNSGKTQLGAGFGGEPEPKASKMPKAAPNAGKIPMRNDAQALGQYPKAIGKAIAKAKK